MALSVRMMWGTCVLVLERVGTRGVGGTLGDKGSTLGADGGETFEGTGGETDGEASAKMVAKSRMAVMVLSPKVVKGAAGAGLSSALVSSLRLTLLRNPRPFSNQQPTT